jgi:hypothetical protein
MLPHLSTAVVMLFVGQAIDVRSTTDCPSAAAIAAKLAPLLPDQRGAGDVAWVESVSPPGQALALRLRLIRADASVAADRRLLLQGGCEELADTVATVLATWETAPVTVVPTELVKGTAQAKVDPKARASGAQLWLGVGAGAGLIGGTVGSGSAELVGGTATSHAQARVAVVGQTRRQRGLGPGEVTWRRTHASLGLGWQFLDPSATSAWQASADGGLLVGWLRALGDGFAPGRTQDAFEVGAGAGLRAGRRVGPWSVWFECRGNLWPAPQRAILQGSQQSTTLPSFDVLATVGLSRLVLR